jgi:two-component system OmpR family sensor kinase
MGSLAWALLSGWGLLPDPVVYLRFSLGVAILAIGVLVSLVALTGLVGLHFSQRNERKHMAQARSAAADAHRRFLLRLDHELKNPLTALQVELANLEAMLPDSGPNDGSAFDENLFVQRIKSNLRRLADLSIGLRKLAELETYSIEREPIEVDQLIRDLVEELAASCERRFNLDLPESPWRLPQVSGDADLLELALRNVLGNAIKFTQLGDTVQVRAFEDNHWVIIEIIDSGAGIPESELPQVWDELFRGKAARGTPGSGLGLALVRAVIEWHGGQAGLHSQIGLGTRLTLRLPSMV